MRPSLLLAVLLAGFTASGQVSPRISVTTDTNGVLLAPLKFFQANQAAISNAVQTIQQSQNTNAVWPVAGANTSTSTNANLVTVNADVSHSEVNTASNNAYAGSIAAINTVGLNVSNNVNAASNSLASLSLTVGANSTNALNSASNVLAGIPQTFVNAASNSLQGKINTLGSNLTNDVNTASNSLVGQAQSAATSAANAVTNGYPWGVKYVNKTGDTMSGNLNVNGSLTLANGIIFPVNAGAGKVYTSDAFGIGSWQTPPSIGSATNVNFTASTYATWDTDGGSNRVSIIGLQPASLNLAEWTSWETNDYANALGLKATNYALTKVSTNAGTSYGQTLFNPTNATIGINVLEAGALGGTNDDTTILNAILAKGGNIYFDPRTNYTAGVLYLTNNTHIRGGGAQINFLTNLTSVTNLVFATNVGNVLIEGLTFNGGNTNDCYSQFRSTNTDRVWCNPCGNQTITFRDVREFGYDFGPSPIPITDGITVQELPRLRFDNVELSTNAVGFYCQSITSTNLLEYLTFSGLTIHDCSYGAWLGGGNLKVIGCDLSHNNVSIRVDGTGGLNPGHGLISNNTFNHDNGPAVQCVNLGTFGESIFGNIFAAGAAKVTIDNCGGVVVAFNQFRGGGGVTVGTAGPGTNIVANNFYTGQWKNPGFTVFDFAVNSYPDTTNLTSWSNDSVDTPGSDDPHRWNPGNTNLMDGPLLTNLNASALASGTVPTARLGSGSATSSTFLRGDQQWATPAGSGNVTGPASSTDGNFAVYNGATGTVISNSAFSPASFAQKANNLSDLASASAARANLSVSATNYGTTLEIRFANGAFMRTNTAEPHNWRFENTNGVVTFGTNGTTQLTLSSGGSLSSIGPLSFESGAVSSDGAGLITASQIALGSLSANTGIYSDSSVHLHSILAHIGIETNDNAGGFGFSTNVPGSWIAAGTINSNRLDSATLAMFGSGTGSGNGFPLAANADGQGFTIFSASLQRIPELSLTNTGSHAAVFADAAFDSTYGAVMTLTGKTNGVASKAAFQGTFNGEGTGLTNATGNRVAFTNELLDASALGASGHVKTGATTNLISSEDFTGYTNSIAFTNFLATTNMLLTFNGNINSGLVTNGPDVFPTFASAGNGSGSWSLRVTTNVTLHLPPQIKWMAGSNNVGTNFVISFTAYGGTNLVEAAIGENQ